MMIPDGCTVRLIDLPYRVGGFVCESPDGHINVYLNARLNRARNRKSFRHEFDHIKNGDLHSDRTIREVERPLREIPGLIRASELLQAKTSQTQGKASQTQSKTSRAQEAPAVPREITRKRPTPYQARILASAIAALDAAARGPLELLAWW